jgi:hypothetical protein
LPSCAQTGETSSSTGNFDYENSKMPLKKRKIVNVDQCMSTATSPCLSNSMSPSHSSSYQYSDSESGGSPNRSTENLNFFGLTFANNHASPSKPIQVQAEIYYYYYLLSKAFNPSQSTSYGISDYIDHNLPRSALDYSLLKTFHTLFDAHW